jgi:hypothetical protein
MICLCGLGYAWTPEADATVIIGDRPIRRSFPFFYGPFVAGGAIPPARNHAAGYSRPRVSSNVAAAPTGGCADAIDPDPVSGS